MSLLRPAALAALLSACAADPPCPTGDLAPPARLARFAVLRTDYGSSAVALLDASGEPISEAWLDSGTRLAERPSGLGGDAFLPRQQWPGALAILERYESDVLHVAILDRGTVRTIDLRGDDPLAPSGHSPNPQDVLRLDERAVLVSRYNPSFDPAAPELARGNDVVVVDLAVGGVVARIDLGADIEVDGAIAFARPASLAMLERAGKRRAVVALARLSAFYDRTGAGAVAAIDPETRERSQLLALEGLSGCGTLAPIPGDLERAVVLCAGDAFADEAGRRLGSGLARIALDAEGTLHVEATWRAADHPDAPAPTAYPVPLDASRALAVADPRGEDEGHDILVRIDLDAGAWDVVLEVEAGFVLGEGAFDPRTGLLLVPDADARVVHRLDVGAAIVHRDALAIAGCGTLPPRQIVLLP